MFSVISLDISTMKSYQKIGKLYSSKLIYLATCFYLLSCALMFTIILLSYLSNFFFVVRSIFLPFLTLITFSIFFPFPYPPLLCPRINFRCVPQIHLLTFILWINVVHYYLWTFRELTKSQN